MREYPGAFELIDLLAGSQGNHPHNISASLKLTEPERMYLIQKPEGEVFLHFIDEESVFVSAELRNGLSVDSTEIILTKGRNARGLHEVASWILSMWRSLDTVFQTQSEGEYEAGFPGLLIRYSATVATD